MFETAFPMQGAQVPSLVGELRFYMLHESESCSVVSNSLRPHRLYRPQNSPGQNTGVGSLSLLQGIFPTQGSNPHLLHCRQILYQLSHNGSPKTELPKPRIEPGTTLPLSQLSYFSHFILCGVAKKKKKIFNFRKMTKKVVLNCLPLV